MSPGPLGHGHHPGTVKDGGTALTHAYKPGPLRQDSHAHPSADLPQVPTPAANNAVLIGTDPSAGPVIYEFDQGKRKFHLSYPNKRSFYAVKDVILITEMDQRNAEKVFPELKDPNEKDASVVSILFMLLAGPDDKRKIGWQIESIQAIGRKRVTLRAILYLDENTPLPLKKVRDLSETELDCWFITERIFAPTVAFANAIEKVIGFLVTAAVTEGVGSIEKYAASEVGEKAIEYGMRRLVRFALKEFVKIGAKCSFAFFRGFLVEYWKDRIQEGKNAGLRARLEAAPEAGRSTEATETMIREKAVIAGIDAMFDAFIDEWWKEPMMKPLDHAFEKVLKRGTGRAVVRAYLKKQSKALVPKLVTIVASVSLDSLKESLKGPGLPDFDKYADKLKENAGGKVIEAVTDWLKDLIGDAGNKALVDSGSGDH